MIRVLEVLTFDSQKLKSFSSIGFNLRPRPKSGGKNLSASIGLTDLLLAAFGPGLTGFDSAVLANPERGFENEKACSLPTG